MRCEWREECVLRKYAQLLLNDILHDLGELDSWNSWTEFQAVEINTKINNDQQDFLRESHTRRHFLPPAIFDMLQYVGLLRQQK